MLKTFWRDESGAIISAELTLVLTIAVLSMVVGLSDISMKLNAELHDIAEAFGGISQTFQFNGLVGCNACWSGSSFNDTVDVNVCDCSCLAVAITHLHAQEKCEGGTL